MKGISGHSSSSDGSNNNNGDCGCWCESDYDEERSYSTGEPAPNRQKTTGKEDEETLGNRLSALPDSLLLHILSLLPMKDVVKTSALSKKWQYLWTCVHNLIFICDDEDYLLTDGAEKFISFVHNTLSLCSCTKIEKFLVHFDYCYSDSDVDSWISFASERNVEDLDLKFYGDRDVYPLPQHLFSNSSLTILKLSFCYFEPSGVISWGSLKSLSLDNLRLSEDVIEKILSGCPLLEVLDLSSFWGFSRLDVTSPNLRTLKLNDLLDDEGGLVVVDDDVWFEISAPNLRSLEISGYLSMKCRLVNVSSLVDANLSFWLSTPIDSTDDCEDHRNMLLKLLERLRHVKERLRHVKELTIGNWCTRVLSISEVKGLPPSLLSCKCLTVDAHISKWTIPGIASLLQASPNLETLLLNMTDREHSYGTNFCKSYNFDGENYWTSQTRIFKCLLVHLKTVKIVGLLGGCGEFKLAFIQFLLKNARVLEKMVINVGSSYQKRCSTCYMSQEYRQVTQKLLSFARSSPNAVILFTE